MRSLVLKMFYVVTKDCFTFILVFKRTTLVFSFNMESSPCLCEVELNYSETLSHFTHTWTSLGQKTQRTNDLDDLESLYSCLIPVLGSELQASRHRSVSVAWALAVGSPSMDTFTPLRFESCLESQNYKAWPQKWELWVCANVCLYVHACECVCVWYLSP
jgi:hypothetical protein